MKGGTEEEEEPWVSCMCIFPWPQQQSSKGSSSRAHVPQFQDLQTFKACFFLFFVTYFGKVRVGTWNPSIQSSKTRN
jgi:hypothetical protein